MSNEKMRQEFEVWLSERPHMGFAGYAWEAWQAARQTRASDTVNCPDCATPLLFECPGCSKMNYPESSRGVDFEMLQAFAEELDADVQVGLQSEDGLDRVRASVKRAVIVRLIGIMDKANQ